jgi:chain length determinant protein EpsF
MNPNRILAALLARHWLVWGGLLLFGGIGLAYSLLATKQYSAQAQILLDVREPEVMLNQGASYSVLAPTYMATQVDIIRSARVGSKVVHSLGLDTNPQAIKQWEEGHTGNETIEEYFRDVLGKSLVVTPSKTSNTMTIEFASPSPEFAASVANAYANAYLEASVDLKVDPTRSFADWFAGKAREERARVEAAQEKLSQFQRENGIAVTDERLDVENTRLAELNTQLTVVQEQLGESKSRDRQAQGMIATSPDVMHNGVVESLRGDIARNEAKLQDLSKQYGKNHPAYVRALAENESLKAALDAEMKKVAGTVGANNEVNVQREAQIRQALAAQKQLVLKLRAQRDQVAVLERDVELAQKTYDAVTQRMSQTDLESKVQSNSNIVVLAQAMPPIKPSSPRMLLNTAAGSAMGLALGMFLAVGLEMRRPRLRSDADVQELLGIPVLTSLQRQTGGGSARLVFGRRRVVAA